MWKIRWLRRITSKRVNAVGCGYHPNDWLKRKRSYHNHVNKNPERKNETSQTNESTIK